MKLKPTISIPLGLTIDGAEAKEIVGRVGRAAAKASGQRGWFADVANSAAAVAERISLEIGKFGVTTSKTSTAVNPEW